MTAKTAHPDAVAAVVPIQVWDEVRDLEDVEEVRDVLVLRLLEGAAALDGLLPDVDLRRAAGFAEDDRLPYLERLVGAIWLRFRRNR